MTALRVQAFNPVQTLPLMVRSALLRASRTMRPAAFILILRDAAMAGVACVNVATWPLLRMRSPARGEGKKETAR